MRECLFGLENEKKQASPDKTFSDTSLPSGEARISLVLRQCQMTPIHLNQLRRKI